MLCLAASSTFARERDSEASSSESKTRSSRHGKTTSPKSSASKRKAKSKASRSRTQKKAAARHKPTGHFSGSGDIDVSGAVWKDLPPEELPTIEAEEADGEPAP